MRMLKATVGKEKVKLRGRRMVWGDEHLEGREKSEEVRGREGGRERGREKKIE